MLIFVQGKEKFDNAGKKTMIFLMISLVLIRYDNQKFADGCAIGNCTVDRQNKIPEGNRGNVGRKVFGQ